MSSTFIALRVDTDTFLFLSSLWPMRYLITDHDTRPQVNPININAPFELFVDHF